MASRRALYTTEEVLGMMDDDGEEIEADVDEPMCDGSDDDLEPDTEM